VEPEGPLVQGPPAFPNSPARWLELALLLPRVVGFVGRASRADPDRAAPPLRRTPLAVVGVAFDDLVSTMQYVLAGDVVARFDMARAESAARILESRDDLADPAALHPAPPPPPPDETGLTIRRLGHKVFEHLIFPSRYEPPADLPGRDEWLADEANALAHAYVLQHDDDRPRPWVVNVHGAGVGNPIDLQWMGSFALYRDLGVNVIHPVLPKHGPRRRERSLAYPSPDGLVNFYAFSQAIWDVRRTIAWVRARGATTIGVHGVSLGGYVAALLAGLENGLDCVVAGLPPSDIPSLVVGHAARYRGVAKAAAEVEAGPPQQLNRLVSPLTFTPRLSRDRLHIYAAVGDRISTPEQAGALWHHWAEPEICWIQGSHLPSTLFGTARRFVRDALTHGGVSAA
jgi:hypothetical protein